MSIINTVTFEVADVATIKARTIAAAVKAGKAAKSAYRYFPDVELLWHVMQPRRWAIVQTLQGQEPLALREVARRLGRDVKRVHEDVHALLDAGVIDKGEDGKLAFPFARVVVNFELRRESAIALGRI